MNQRIQKLWIAALTSGNYEQGHNRLRESNAGDFDTPMEVGDYRWCCLGVLCDLYAQEHDHDGNAFADVSYPGVNVMAWADLGLTESRDYAEMNDGAAVNGHEKQSFETIAEAIALDDSHWLT